MSLKLDQRKEAILAAVVEENIHTGQPVGSRTVVKKGLKASPATVRNEMAELERLGLLEQPHTSAGRTPTDSGFRYYVDHLVDRSLSIEDREEVDSLYRTEVMSADELVAETARMLSELSNNVGVVMVVRSEQAPLRSVHFFKHGKDRIRVVLRFQGGGQEEKLIANERRLDPGVLTSLTNYVNSLAHGRSLVGLRRELLRQIEDARAYVDTLLARAAELSERMVGTEGSEVFVRGQANLLDLPEFSEIDKVREVVRALEEKNLLVRLLEQAALAAGTRIFIGSESMVENLQHCSVITSGYGSGDRRAGTLGVIGPVRMDYARLIPLVNYTSELISEYLRRHGK